MIHMVDLIDGCCPRCKEDADQSEDQFDQDIKDSVEDGSFDLAFPEVCPIQ